MKNNIIKELGKHAPFTFFGALTGIILMSFFYRLPYDISHTIFYVLHPTHVLLSALVTASLFKIYSKKANLLKVLLIGYFGSIGIASLSDSLIPYLGEILLSLPNPGIHLGFIEKWWLVTPLAIAGSVIAYLWPTTKIPHTGHVLISTWASLFHVIMALGGIISIGLSLLILVFLFFSVLVPCCLSDIVFPLLFVKKKN